MPLSLSFMALLSKINHISLQLKEAMVATYDELFVKYDGDAVVLEKYDFQLPKSLVHFDLDSLYDPRDQELESERDSISRDIKDDQDPISSHSTVNSSERVTLDFNSSLSDSFFSNPQVPEAKADKGDSKIESVKKKKKRKVDLEPTTEKKVKLKKTKKKVEKDDIDDIFDTL
ncbi:hypothetical protein HK098_006078 [Nowakowskiella sp. JEL0407]|nr:hypothetical protein HK098_006078 [Nowakowskiella sp. JEL0407]